MMVKIALAPPLTITESEIDEMIDSVRAALDPVALEMPRAHKPTAAQAEGGASSDASLSTP
jgi:hypothetical protein